MASMAARMDWMSKLLRLRVCPPARRSTVGVEPTLRRLPSSMFAVTTSAVQARREITLVHPDLGRVVLEGAGRKVRRRPPSLVAEEEVVVLPERSLIGGAACGTGRQEGVGMDGDEREVVEDELGLTGVHQLLHDGRLGLESERCAARALVVPELEDLHRGRRITQRDALREGDQLLVVGDIELDGGRGR